MGIQALQDRLNDLQREFQDLQEEATGLAKEVQAKYNRMQQLNEIMIRHEGKVQEVSKMLEEAKKQESVIIEA